METNPIRYVFIATHVVGAGILALDLMQRMAAPWSGLKVEHAIALMLAGIGGYLMTANRER